MATSLFGAPPVSRPSDISRLQAQINQQGLTQEQAKARYGLGDDMVEWLGQNGVSFSAGKGLMDAPTIQPVTQGQAQPPGLAIAAQMGRNGDTQMAHMTPGEKVLPAQVAAARPDVAQQLDSAIASAGGDPRRYTVGQGRINPATGVQEFAFTPAQQTYYDSLINKPGAGTPEELTAYVSSLNDIQARASTLTTNSTSGGSTSLPSWITSSEPGAYEAWLAENNLPADVLTQTVGGVPVTSTGQPYTGPASTGTTGGTTGTGGTTTGTTGTSGGTTSGGTTTGGATGGTPGVIPGGTATSTDPAHTVTTPSTTGAALTTVTPESGSQSVVAGQGVAGNYTATGATAAAPVTAGAAQASLTPEASLWNVDNSSTVQGQLASVLDSNSPLMQRAGTQALQEANRRGLANSTMAVQAGQTALYDRALPIAQQDANTFAQAGQFNAAARNQRDQFNSQLATQVSMFNVDKALQAGIVNQEQANKMAELNAQMVNRASEFNITTNSQMAQFNIEAALKAGIVNQQQANAMLQFNAEQANKMATFNAGLSAQIDQFNASEANDLIALGMDSETKLQLAQIEANYKTLMQTSASGADLYKSSIASIAQILQNTDMDEAAKSAAIADITGMLNGSLDLVGAISNLDLPELTFDVSAPATTAGADIAADTGTNTTNSTNNGSSNVGLFDVSGTGGGGM
jgi:hypothetical protein